MAMIALVVGAVGRLFNFSVRTVAFARLRSDLFCGYLGSVAESG